MTSPADNTEKTARDKSQAVFSVGRYAMPSVLKKRADFVQAAKARYCPCAGFVLQARQRDDNDALRIGFTCSKKIGNAVARNRAKRRLREIARLILNDHGLAGWDYVLIGRRDTTASVCFERLQSDLIRALEKVHQ